MTEHFNLSPGKHMADILPARSIDKLIPKWYHRNQYQIYKLPENTHHNVDLPTPALFPEENKTTPSERQQHTTLRTWTSSTALQRTIGGETWNELIDDIESPTITSRTRERKFDDDDDNNIIINTYERKRKQIGWGKRGLQGRGCRRQGRTRRGGPGLTLTKHAASESNLVVVIRAW